MYEGKGTCSVQERQKIPRRVKLKEIDGRINLRKMHSEKWKHQTKEKTVEE